MQDFLKKIRRSKAKIELVAMDMGRAFIAWGTENLPDAKIVFDHFHVIKLMNDILDKARRRTMVQLDDDQRSALKNKRFVLLHNEEDLDAEAAKDLVKGLSKDEIERRVRMIEQSMVGGACLIYCDYIEPPDNCLVEAADDYSLKEYRDRPDDVIEFQFREMFRKQLGDRAKVYEVKRFSVAGTQCIRVNASLNPGKGRSIYHWILLPGRAIQFTQNVRQENYHQRMEEFSECLKTLKFGSATK